MTLEEFLDRGPALMDAYWDKQPEERRLRGVSVETMLSKITEEERLEGISAEKRLEGVPEKVLERYLAEMKKKSQ